MPTLPYPNTADVKVFSNEYINVNTLNRALLRLFYNDDYLASLSSLDPVDLPTVSNMMLISTGPGTYTWQTDTQVKSSLNITDEIFGLSDVDDNASNMLNGYGLFWDASKNAFVGKKGATELTDLEDVTITSPVNLHSILYSTEYGAFINGFPDEFTVGYVQHVTLEADGKVLLPEVTTVGQQIVVTKVGTSTSVYVVPNASNKINGQSSKSLVMDNTDEIVSTVHIRSVLRNDDSIEWVTVGGDGTSNFMDTSLVPGSSIQIRTITDEDLMLAPYEIDFTGAVDATELVKGIVRLATDAEAQAGTAKDIAVTPWGVKYWFDNFAIPFTSDVDFATGTATDEVASVKQIADADANLKKLYSPAYYSVKVATETNLTTPTDFDTATIIAEYDDYSRGSITHGYNNNAYTSGNSLLYEMEVEVDSLTDIDLQLFEVDDSIYIYVDDVLQSSQVVSYANGNTPVDLGFALGAGTYTIQIVKNDSGGGSNRLSLIGKVIGQTVHFVNPY